MDKKAIEKLINDLAKQQVPSDKEFKLVDKDERLSATNVDSYGFVMIYVAIGDLFDIKQKSFDEKLPKGDVFVKQFIDFIIECKTKEPTAEEIEDVLI